MKSQIVLLWLRQNGNEAHLFGGTGGNLKNVLNRLLLLLLLFLIL